MFKLRRFAAATGEAESVTDLLGSNDPAAIGLGRFVEPDIQKPGEKLRYGGDRHILVFGPNGSGKGMRLLTPNLLQIRDRSLVVIDPKGELAAISAGFRRTIGDVVIINPFGVLLDIPGYEDLASAGYNPIAYLDPDSPSFNADAAWLSEALVTLDGRDLHWARSARKLIAALIMYVRLRHGPTGTLAQVRQLLTEPVKEVEGVPVSGLPRTALDMIDMDVPVLANKAGQFTNWNREIQSIVSTADSQTEALDDTEVAIDLSRPGIDFRRLKTHPTTIYIILPPDMMERQSRWLRMLISAALRGVMRLRKKGEYPVAFIMDEFAALGHLPIIESTWALVRGYGIQLIPVLQDLNQLKALYKERWETFVGMAGATVAFGPNDLTTADWMSRRGGNTTLVLEGFNTGLSTASGLKPTINRNEGSSFAQTRLPFLSAHDLLDTPDGRLYIWLAGIADTVPAYAPLWSEIAQCRARARENPYYLKR